MATTAVNCYNFSSQEVFLADCNPSLISVIDDNQLVVVLETTASIRIYDLTVIGEHNKPIVTIPLTDANVKRLVHSDVGHYLALLADDQKSKTVRIYTNYWIEGQPIRVRPHGSLANKDKKYLVDYHSRESMSIEVIELKDMSIANDCQDISCCQSSADLFLVCGHRVMLFGHQSYKLSTNLIQSDFVFLLDIKLEWFATRLSSVGSYIAIMSKTHCSLLSLDFEYDQNSTQESEEPEVENKCSEQSNCIEWDFSDYSKTIRLPTLFDTQSDTNYLRTHCQQVIGPVDQSLCCKFGLNMNHSNVELPICRASLQVLMCQYFESDEPLIDVQVVSYNRETLLPSDPLNASKLETMIFEKSLTNNESNDMIGSALLVMTKSYLYIYNIFNRIELKQKMSLSEQIRSYSFNKSDDSLHFVTDSGLKTYGTNFMPVFLNQRHVFSNFQMNFRTFLNIEFLLNTKNYLLLVTESHNELRTIYSLRKPSLRHITADITALLNQKDLTPETKYNLMSYLSSILHFSCNLSKESDTEIQSVYRKIAIDLCNFVIESDSIDSKVLAQSLLESAKLEFSHLINYKSNYEMIFVFIAKRLDSEQSFDVTKCDISLLKGFLSVLCAKDCTMFCRFSLSQALESDVRHLIIGLLSAMDSTLDSHWPKITLSKLLLDNNDIERANNYMNSLIDSKDLHKDLSVNYKLIFLNKNFVKYFESRVPNIFYSTLISLAQMVNSIEFVVELLDEFEFRIAHNFLNLAFNSVPLRPLLVGSKCKLIVSLVAANVRLLTNSDRNATNVRYFAIESIERPSLEWMDELPPYHRQNECFCVKCNPIVSDLYILLCEALNEDIIKTDINNIISRIDVQNEILFTARLLSMDISDALEVVLNDFPHILFPYVSHVCGGNTRRLQTVINLFATKIDNTKDIDIDSNIGTALSFALNQLALNLTPEELIELLPHSWRDFAFSFVRKSIINMQSNVLRQEIIDSALQLSVQ